MLVKRRTASPVTQLWDDAIHAAVVYVPVWKASLCMASYHTCMERSELRNLVVAALSRPGYGETAEGVLSTCRLVGQAEETFNPRELYDIRKEVGMSEQVWKRMCAVSRNETLWALRESLPRAFSSLYRLNLLKDYECFVRVRDKSINPETTTRDIEQITKRSRINSRYNLSQHQIYFFSNNDLSKDDLRNLLEEINVIAKDYEAFFDSEDLEQLRKSDEQYLYDRRMENLRWSMLQDIENLNIVELIDDEINDEDERDSVSDGLINSSFKDFTETLMSISFSRENMMEDYGELYCTKIAYEFWRTESRSQRYNYKRRLGEVKSKYPKNEEFIAFLMEKFMDV